MITQELISYIKGEFNKGKTREDIRAALLQGGGWSAVDLDEAFRTTAPSSSSASTPAVSGAALSPAATFSPPAAAVNPVSKAYAAPISRPAGKSRMKSLIVFLLILLLVGGGGYFYRSRLGSAWETFESKFASLSFFEDGEKDGGVLPPAPTDNTPPLKVINCGETQAPDIKAERYLGGNTTLICLGVNALACENAKGILSDPLFPNVFEIKKDPAGGVCRFQLSYSSDSNLESITGNKLAGQSLSCPLSAVRSFKEGEKKTLVFGSAAENIPSKYGAEIYFYGTTGVFIEGDFKEEKISAMGCTGSFIKSVIDSYNLLKSNN